MIIESDEAIKRPNRPYVVLAAEAQAFNNDISHSFSHALRFVRRLFFKPKRSFRIKVALFPPASKLN